MIAAVILHQFHRDFARLGDGSFEPKGRLMCLAHLRADRPTRFLRFFEGTTWI